MLTFVQSVFKCLFNEIWYNCHLLKQEDPEVKGM